VKDDPLEIQAAKNAISNTERRLKRAGLTRSYYFRKLKEFCEAQKTVSCVSGKGAGSGSVDFVDVPDYRIQLDAVKTIIDLYGDKAPEKRETRVSGEIRGSLSPELQELFASIYGAKWPGMNRIRHTGS
jgi:hypothetical protein